MKGTLLIFSLSVPLIAVWYTGGPSPVDERDSSRPSSGKRTAVPQPLTAVRNRSFSVFGDASLARFKAIGSAPEDILRARKGFVAGSGHAGTSASQHTTAIFDRESVIDPDAPGNSLTIDGRRAGVERLSVSSGTTALELVIASSGEALSRKQADAPGFSYEEELFRTKWGWTAFEKTGRAVREDALTANP